MSRYTLLFLNGAILTVCAVFIYDARAFVLTGLMLFLPLFDMQWQHRDRHWRLPFSRMLREQTSAPGERGARNRSQLVLWLLLTFLTLALIMFNPQHANTALIILLLTALPEEWFFRAYVQTRTERLIIDNTTNISPHKIMWLANITTSGFFALTHLPTQGVAGLWVLLPSLLFGWLYQAYRDLPLVILLHTLSNLFFIIYLRDMLLVQL